jgi:hypothetical protein
MNDFPAASFSAVPHEYADAALSRAVATMRPGWVVLRGCVLGDEAAPAQVRYALLHAQVGIALLDVVPGTTNPRAADDLRQRLDAAGFCAEFGRTPPILYLCVPLRAIPDAGRLLEQEFDRQPVAALPRSDAWVAAAQSVLSAHPLGQCSRQLPASAENSQEARRDLATWHRADRQLPVRRFGGLRLLAAFWGLVMVTAGGGVLLLQYYGPPEKAAASADGSPSRPPDAGPALAAAPAPPAIVEAPGLSGGDLQGVLAENDRAIIDLQRRLKRFEGGAEAGPDTNALAVGTMAPELAATLDRDAAAHAQDAHAQEMADFSKRIDAAHAQEAATRLALAQLAEEAGTRSADAAQSEAALQQIRQARAQAQAQAMDAQAQLDRLAAQRTEAEQRLGALQQQVPAAQEAAETVQRRLADMTAQAEQVAQQVAAAEQRLAALQRRSEDAQAVGAAVGKPESDAQAQIRRLAEQRSAPEPQKEASVMPVEPGQKEMADTEARLAKADKQPDQAVVQHANAEQPFDIRQAGPAGTAQAALSVRTAHLSASIAAMPDRMQDPASPSAAAAHAMAADASRAGTLPAITATMAAMMVRRGDTLFQHGDVSAARLLYGRAASAGFARAATAMGKTYDAALLAGVGAIGLSADPALAASWYRRGLSLGDEDAGIQLQALSPERSSAQERSP